MVKTYFPIKDKAIFVEASAPHPAGTEYKVSLGVEVWNGESHDVVKVQMVYDGEVAGRKSPSYPMGSDDFERVREAVDELVG